MSAVKRYLLPFTTMVEAQTLLAWALAHAAEHEARYDLAYVMPRPDEARFAAHFTMLKAVQAWMEGCDGVKLIVVPAGDRQNLVNFATRKGYHHLRTDRTYWLDGPPQIPSPGPPPKQRLHPTP